MAAVAKEKDVVRRRARVRLPKAQTGKDGGAETSADADQQIRDLERTFTDRWEW